jgi:hypothetical protein
MGVLVRIVLTIALGLGPSGRSLAEGPLAMTLRVGQSIPFSPGGPAHVMCDDVSVVGVRDVAAHLELTGLRIGTTLCSFGSVNRPGRPQVYRITVTP